MALFWDHPEELVLEENFWTLWCKGRLTKADTPTKYNFFYKLLNHDDLRKHSFSARIVNIWKACLTLLLT